MKFVLRCNRLAGLFLAFAVILSGCATSFSPRSVALSEIEFLEWERLFDQYRRQPGSGESKINP